jgi:AraC-like DNA-binding protein
MNPHAPVIPLHLHPLGFIESFTRLGARLDALLRGTGIESPMLDCRDARISYAQQRQLVANGIAQCTQAGLGLLVGLNFDWNFYGSVGGVVRCSPTLRDAGEAFLRYLMILQPYYSEQTRQPNSYVGAGGLLIYPLQCFPAPAEEVALMRFEFEFRLAITLRLWDECGNKEVADPQIHVCLNYPEPSHGHLYRSLPCADIRFGAKESHLAAHVDFVTRPFRQFRKPLFDRIMAQCEAELESAKLETRYEAKVRWYLHANFSRQVSLEQAAESLSVTPRTLERKLAAENASFRQLTHEVKMELAAYHLRCSRLSVEQIAELTGFSSASSMQRAIRNWSGAQRRRSNASAQSPVRRIAGGALAKSIAVLQSAALLPLFD